MSTVSLPLIPSLPNYTFSCSLDNTVYNFRVLWNASDGAGAWYLDISDADNNLIRAGMKVVLGTVLGGRETNPAFPPGALSVVDLASNGTTAGTDAGIDDLGARVIVVYYPAADVAAFFAAL